MTKYSSISTVLLTFALLVSLSACGKVSLNSSGGKPPSDGTATGGQAGGPTAASGPAVDPNAPLEGYWTIAFKFGDQVPKASVQIHQQGNQLSGSGTDDEGGHAFNVAGTVNGNDVTFVKQYESPDSKTPVPAVQYVGSWQIVNDKDYQGPYMSGQYNTIVKGKQVSDNWEAQMSSAQGGGEQAGGEQSGGGEAAPPAGLSPPSGKTPDVSGKWKVAFKSNFKTIKSTMFLEQDGSHLTGRGLDQNTNEKFDIEKGWYNFPKITMVRTYKKGKGGAASDRTATFKGTVEWVNDKDYQGPYLHGETQGGGDWEAQLVR